MPNKRVRLVSRTGPRGKVTQRNVCAFCGNVFWERARELEHKKADYCKHSCYMDWLRAPTEGPLHSGMSWARAKWRRARIRMQRKLQKETT
jgi:hypothetical protein